MTIDDPIFNHVPTIAITNANLYIPVVTLSTEDNAKLLQQVKLGFKKTTNWNKYQSKLTIHERNRYLDYLIDLNFQGVNRLFVLSFENNNIWNSYKRYFPPTVEINNYNVMIDGQNFFDQTIQNNLRRYDNIWKIATGQADNYATGCLIDYHYFREYFKMVAIGLSK